jgi:hypothetical protein
MNDEKINQLIDKLEIVNISLINLEIRIKNLQVSIENLMLWMD